MIRIALALMLWAAPVSARNGEILYAMCQTSDTSELSAGFCMGAVGSLFQVMKNGNSINGFTACFPDDFDTMDAINTVMHYFEINVDGTKLNLQELNIPSAVAMIFMMEFSCDR